MIEGPAGTGKTRAVLEKINYLAETYPGSRYLLCRKTLRALRESVQITLEQKVWWPGHPCLTTGGGTFLRTHYDYPNGSHIALGGLDDPEHHFSTEFDVIACFETIQIIMDHWEKFGRCMRNNVVPYQQRIADTNPGPTFHWLNQRAQKGRMTRILSRHEDNPTITEDYLKELRAMTGANRARMYEGLWVPEVGIVYDEWVADTHVLDGWYEIDDDLNRWVVFRDGTRKGLKYCVAGVDWGFRNPGTLLVFGVDGDGILYLLSETYQSQRQLDWWAEEAVELKEKYNIRRFFCDPAEPGNIEKFNDRMGSARGRDGERWAVKADNDTRAGRDQLKSLLFDHQTLKPAFYVLEHRDLRGGKDAEMSKAHRPCTFQEEIESQVWRESTQTQMDREDPDPACADHALDAVRYVCMGIWKRNYSQAVKTEPYPEGSYGDILDHRAVTRPKRPRSD